MKNLEPTPKQLEDLINTLKFRFENNKKRHQKIEWSKIEAKLKANKLNLLSLYQMEQTGGEPDVIDFDKEKEVYTFCDCSAESPKDRRSLCYDTEALESRKEFKPKNSAKNMAKEMGIELITEEQYRKLQTFGEFDTKTSSWIETPITIRKLGGAIFADRRYDHVFVYHNGAESYYASRGFRGILKVC